MNQIIVFLANQNKLNRSWTKEETNKYKKMNDEALIELNKTLTGSFPYGEKKKLNLGIFCPGQQGDLITVMSVLQHSDILWPNHNIIFYTNFPNADSLRFAPISEVRPYPWANNGLPENTPDFYPLLCTDNGLNKELSSQYELTKDLDVGFFPTPWMVASEKQHGIPYTDCSKMVFGVPSDWAWRPYLSWSEEEKDNAHGFMYKLPKGRKNILLETFCGSGQAYNWDEFTTKKIMAICRDKLGPTNFIFASHAHKGGVNNIGLPHEMFIDEEGVVSAAHFTVRQAGFLINYCDLMVCMSSGISCATSAWDLKSVPKLQYCGSKKCSTAGIANGEFHLVEMDGRPKKVADKEFFSKLEEILLTI
ncbi:MAG: hypothetical protein AABY22_27415 [Nanoarchaeota archaeon]